MRVTPRLEHIDGGLQECLAHNRVMGLEERVRKALEDHRGVGQVLYQLDATMPATHPRSQRRQ